MCNILQEVKCNKEKDFLSGEVWEGFTEKKYINGALKDRQEFSGRERDTFQTDMWRRERWKCIACSTWQGAKASRRRSWGHTVKDFQCHFVCKWAVIECRRLKQWGIGAWRNKLGGFWDHARAFKRLGKDNENGKDWLQNVSVN